MDKICVNCGNPMHGVGKARKYCAECRNLLRRESDRERNRLKAMKDLLSPSVKSIEQCVREADAQGLTYGQYVSRGLDKEVF